MAKLSEYQEKYQHVRIERSDGILQLQLHTDGGSLQWGAVPHEELGDCFAHVAGDLENEVVILTGAGESFCEGYRQFRPGSVTSADWAPMMWHARRLLTNLLSIEVPIIGAINGPAIVHAELGLLSDIVIAAEHAMFQDRPHFDNGLVPGDGVHVLWPLLLGPNRGRHFLLMAPPMTAREALDLGVVAEVVPADQLLDRAWAIARHLMARPRSARQYARVILTQKLRKDLLELLGFGLALEGLAMSEPAPEP